MTGGKRDGAGRPVSNNPASKMITAKLTQEQYKRWVELGASRWLKRILNEKSVDKNENILQTAFVGHPTLKIAYFRKIRGFFAFQPPEVSTSHTDQAISEVPLFVGAN